MAIEEAGSQISETAWQISETLIKSNELVMKSNEPTVETPDIPGVIINTDTAHVLGCPT